MSDVTRILGAIDAGGTQAAEELLPLVYDELRQLAAVHLAREKPGQTLQATALVHEAYLRLIRGSVSDGETDSVAHASGSVTFANRAHFFAAAAEAMRRILVESARRRNADKRGGDLIRVELGDADVPASTDSEDLIALDEALTRLAEKDPQAADLVKLRYFAGLTATEAAEVLGLSPRTADRTWAYARVWLRRCIRPE